MPAASETFVALKGGLTVPVAPLLLVFQLQERGFTLSQEGDVLVIRPRRLLTDADCQAITRWKHHILALLAYEPPEVS